MDNANPPPPFATLDREQLSAKLARGDRFKLVMVSSDWAFRAKHLPGSVHFKTPDEMFRALDKDEEIVVYCSNVDCHASLATIQKLVEHGYRRVAHYAGGLIDWGSARLPLEGDWADDPRGNA
jgi:rhodanese-related sulfurtransferase